MPSRLESFCQLPYSQQLTGWIDVHFDFLPLSKPNRPETVFGRKFPFILRDVTVLDAYLCMIPWIAHSLAFPFAYEALCFLYDLNCYPDTEFQDSICCKVMVLFLSLILYPIFFSLFLAFGILDLVLALVKVVLVPAVFIPQACLVIPICNCWYGSRTSGSSSSQNSDQSKSEKKEDNKTSLPKKEVEELDREAIGVLKSDKREPTAARSDEVDQFIIKIQ